MSAVTNEFAKETLKAIRAYEDGERDEKALAKTLAQINVLKESLSEACKKIKGDMSDTYSGEVHYFPEIAEKVYPGRSISKSEYDVVNIQKKVAPEIFASIVDINAKKVEQLENPYVIKLVKNNKTTSGGDEDVIKVGKMTKTELIDYAE